MLLNRAILGMFSLLMFILSISGTMALRSILSTILLLLLTAITVKNYQKFLQVISNKDFLVIVISLLLFIFYILYHSFYISHEAIWSLGEFKGHIFYPALYFLMGTLLAAYIGYSGIATKRTIISIIFYSMFVHIFYLDLVAIDKLFHDGVMIRRYGGLMNSPVLPNYLTNILLAMIISEFIYRIRVGKQMLHASNGVLYLLLSLSIFSTFVEALRLGDIALVFLGIGASIVFLYQNNDFSKKVRRFIAFALVFILTIPLIYNVSTDKRWGNLVETVPIAISTSDSKHWLSKKFEAPVTKSGYRVDGSNYKRIVWAKKSLEYIYDDPQGIGFGRNAFGHALEMRHPELANRGSHSHSSILDLTIGVGIIGLALWLLFIFVVIRVAIRRFKSNYNYFSMLTLFLTMGFVGRSFVDSNMRDHMFLQFMLILGISVYFLIQDQTDQVVN